MSVLAAAGASATSAEHAVTIFIAEVAVMLLVGRLIGELMQRLGQPAVMGQLLAGIVIGPSVLGALWPAGQHALFPGTPEQKRMIDALAQFGVLLLLLLSGMETDLGLIGRMRRTAIFSSATGIVVPFACGVFVGLWVPASVLPDESRRFVTALFIATCLSVSSVKIVAMVIMEAGFTRRNIGQVILATAILDDTIGWTIVGVIAGFAARGSVDVHSLAFTVAGTLVFLGLSLTGGRRLVAHLIRWTNDHVESDFAVITLILVLTCGMALLTASIGVHTALGAFVAGILVGQSPILTRRIDDQLRGPIVALFMPVFFTLAGLSIDVRILGNRGLVELGLLFLGVACFGKLVGGYVGGESANGRFASSLAGVFVGTRQITTTVLTIGDDASEDPTPEPVEVVRESADTGARRTEVEPARGAATALTMLTHRVTRAEAVDAVLAEARKGYDVLFLGVAHAFEQSRADFSDLVERIVREFPGATAVALANGHVPADVAALRILVPTTGADYSRRAAEVAIAIARGGRRRITALYVRRSSDLRVFSEPAAGRRGGRAVLDDVAETGEREGVRVDRVTRVRRDEDAAILAEIRRGAYDLVVLGVKRRPGDRLFFGETATAVLQRAPCPLLLVNS